MMTINGSTKLFACIAHPSDHVRAPTLFQERFKASGKNAVMVPMDVKPEGLAHWVAAMRQMPNFHGSAVTIPHKMTLADLCDHLGPVAQITKSVNAVRFQNGQLYGDNFDGAGFVAGLYAQKHTLTGKRILLIGAGGAARAIAYALSCEPIDQLIVQNRTIEKAHALVEAVKAHKPDAALSASEQVELNEFDIVINSTALGLKPEDGVPCDVMALADHALVCDIIMVPEQTKWLSQATDRGLACHYGRHMLDYQVELIASFIGANE